MRSVGGWVDMQWHMSAHLHVNEAPIALDVGAPYEPLPLPTSLSAPLEFAMASADNARGAGSDGTAEVAVRSAALPWQTLPLAKRSRQPMVHVGEAWQGAPRIPFSTPSDRVWLRRGSYVIELRFRSSVDGVTVSHEESSDWLYFTPARPDRSGAHPTADSGG
jgi:hypothetical protein